MLNQLGKKTEYKSSYDNNLLYPISRDMGRSNIMVDSQNLPFFGFDLWNCYELSWLNISGKPEVRILELIVPADSPNIIESKSLKLYLNSFNNSKFENEKIVAKLIQKDLNQAIGKPIILNIKHLRNYYQKPLSMFSGSYIDALEIEIDQPKFDRKLLQLCQSRIMVDEILCSDLLKSNCLVTNQPDWASLQIQYEGMKIDQASLLKYLVSMRDHNEFHEQCVERIFIDIMDICSPKELTIYARYTRRGGIDINPIRSTFALKATEISNIRHIRQ